MSQQNPFLQLALHPLRFRVFLLTRLPSAYFSGVRIRDLDDERCLVTVPYKWFSKNPFRSTYFACLSMAAEMSTGALAMARVYKQEPPVSMLVVKMEADYFKKADGRTSFLCKDGKLLDDTIRKAIATKEGQTVRISSAGTNEKGELVAEFFITWSFKVKKSKG
jgi:hypothetical protein